MYLLANGHGQVRDSRHALAALIGFANESFNATRISLGLLSHPIVHTLNNTLLGALSENRVHHSSLFFNLGFGDVQGISGEILNFVGPINGLFTEKDILIILIDSNGAEKQEFRVQLDLYE